MNPQSNKAFGSEAHPSLESVTTIRSDGSRRFLFPADVRGRFTTLRIIAAVMLILIYGILPWVHINGFPAVFLDVRASRFHLFGGTLGAQDMWLLFFLLTGVGFGLFFITALLGRIWCGWACPQTVFLDQVYRRIERLIDGDAPARKALEEAPTGVSKALKRLLKHSLFFLVSAIIAHLFLAYFISIPSLWEMMQSAPAKNWGLFAFVFIFTGVLYFNFAWFREQLCIVICPYGRLQSVLIDDNSQVIGYDAKRGEPRGKLGTAGAGDCIACNRCVGVCPTGIDIRQGLQLECIGCSACIDACDEIMTRVGKPKGLIRYDSLKGFAGAPTRWVRPRTIIYTLIFIGGAALAGYNFMRVKPANLAITRMVGTPYIVDSENVRNQFMVRIVNKKTTPATFVISVEGKMRLQQVGLDEKLTLAPMEETVRPLVVNQSRGAYQGPFGFSLVLRDDAATFTIKRELRFLGPDADLLEQEDHEKGIHREK